MSFFVWISVILNFFFVAFCNVVVLSIIYGGLLFSGQICENFED